MKLPEAHVVLMGTAILYKPVKDFDTQAPAGAKVGILAGAGATEVKYTQDDVNAGRAPSVGEQIAVLVEPMAWQMDNGQSGVTFLFRGALDLATIDSLHAIASGSTEKASK